MFECSTDLKNITATPPASHRPPPSGSDDAPWAATAAGTTRYRLWLALFRRVLLKPLRKLDHVHTVPWHRPLLPQLRRPPGRAGPRNKQYTHTRHTQTHTNTHNNAITQTPYHAVTHMRHQRVLGVLRHFFDNGCGCSPQSFLRHLFTCYTQQTNDLFRRACIRDCATALCDTTRSKSRPARVGFQQPLWVHVLCGPHQERPSGASESSIGPPTRRSARRSAGHPACCSPFWKWSSSSCLCVARAAALAGSAATLAFSVASKSSGNEA